MYNNEWAGHLYIVFILTDCWLSTKTECNFGKKGYLFEITLHVRRRQRESDLINLSGSHISPAVADGSCLWSCTNGWNSFLLWTYFLRDWLPTLATTNCWLSGASWLETGKKTFSISAISRYTWAVEDFRGLGDYCWGQIVEIGPTSYQYSSIKFETYVFIKLCAAFSV